MATRSPIVLVSGQPQQLQSADILPVGAIPGPVTLATGTSSAVASQIIDLTNFYNVYSTIEIHIISMKAVTDNVNLNMVVSTDGTNFDTAAASYEWQIYSGNTSSSANSGNNSDVSMRLAGGIIGVSSLSTATVSACITANNLADATLLPTFRVDLSYVTTGTFLIARNVGASTRTLAQITKAIRLAFSSGNISTMSWRVVGIK